MGEHQGQGALFSYGVDLERRVRADHPLRRVAAMIDFTFARGVVAHLYGANGNVSVDPAILLKLMFLLFHGKGKRGHVLTLDRTGGGTIRALFDKHHNRTL